MKGTIRFFLGFFLTLGAVGGFENELNSQSEMIELALAVLGLLIMYSGAKALNGDYNDAR